MPNFEYCCLKHSCNPVQSTTIGLNDSHHILTSPTRVKENLYTFATSGKLCVSIQSFVLNRCASKSSSRLPENFGLKYDQFNWGCTGFGIWTGGAGGHIGLGTSTGGFCGCIGSSTWAGGLGNIGSSTGARGFCGVGGTGFGTWSGGNGASGSSRGWGAGCWGVGIAAFAGLHTVGSFGAGGPLSAIVASVFTDLV